MDRGDGVKINKELAKTGYQPDPDMAARRLMLDRRAKKLAEQALQKEIRESQNKPKK